MHFLTNTEKVLTFCVYLTPILYLIRFYYQEKMIKILVLIDTSAEFNRRFLNGLLDYANENGPWQFYRLPHYYLTTNGERGLIERVKEWKIDAIISQWGNENLDFLEKLGIPVFIQSYSSINPNFSKIAGDYQKGGRMAAEFFIKKLYRNFAYYGNKNYYWSKARGEGFREVVEKAKGNYFEFESEALNAYYWGRTHSELQKWLLSLPKPIALMACDDYFALQVAEICKINGINIPNEIILLGVDNDELICNLSHPSISSIVTDDKRGGYETGKMLHERIITKQRAPFDIVIDALRIEQRMSTESYNINDPSIKKIIEYIENNITSTLAVDDLADIANMSRRKLELKFKAATGNTIHKFITDKKMNWIASQLISTDKSLLDLALEIGYNDVRSVYRIFKDNMDITPLSYRKLYSKN